MAKNASNATNPQSETAAEAIAGIYDELERGHEEHLQPSNILDDVFGLGAAQTMEDWIEEHRDFTYVTSRKFVFLDRFPLSTQ